MYMYAFAFHLKPSLQQEIFLQNQDDLESATEKLSGFLERNIGTETDGAELRRNVLDCMAYCEKRREILTEYVHEGNEAESWAFSFWFDSPVRTYYPQWTLLGSFLYSAYFFFVPSEISTIGIMRLISLSATSRTSITQGAD